MPDVPPRPVVLPPPALVPERVDARGVPELTARRLLNVGVAAVALLLLSPLMAGIALLVKLSSPGPVLFTQTRVGVHRRRRGRRHGGTDLGGRPFTIYKFRTMRQAPAGVAAWALADDPRITSVGRVLRRTRLDELPQLWNVLRGDMNVVGPRPEQPTIAVALRAQVPRYSRRHLTLPGITGWAQIHQAYDRTVDDVRRKVGLDLEYLERASPAEDLRIMLRTLPVMFLGRTGW